MDNFLFEIFRRLAEQSSQAIVHEVSARTTSYSKHDLRQAIGCIQNGLEANGVALGDRVVLIAPNSFRWVAADLAIMGAGALCVPLYTRQSSQEWIWTILDCRAKLTIVADETSKIQIITQDSSIKCVTFDELMRYSFSEPVSRASSSAIATIVYTSGTSGLPKGAMLSVGNLTFMLKQVLTQLASATKGISNERVFHYLPVCFMGSRIMLFTQLCRGQAIYFSSDLNKLKEELAAVDPSYYLNVPALLERIRTGVTQALMQKSAFMSQQVASALRVYFGASVSLKDRLSLFFCQKIVFPKIRTQLGKNLQFLICGSAPLRAETQAWFEMIGVPVLQVYGLTETTAIISMDQRGDASPGSVGKALDGVELKLSQEGELLTKGPHIFQGYWNRTKETAEAFEGDWLKTGDLAETSSTGHIKILGRAKNVLVLESGHNVVSETLEEKLQSYCSQAEHVVVIGHGKPFLTAIVSGKVSQEDANAAIAQLNSELPHYKKIKKVYVSQESLTPENGLLTANQKIKRSQVQHYFNEPIARMYENAERAL